MLEQRRSGQQDLLLALSFCRAVYGLTFRKGRSGMLRRNNEVNLLLPVSREALRADPELSQISEISLYVGYQVFFPPVTRSLYSPSIKVDFFHCRNIHEDRAVDANKP